MAVLLVQIRQACAEDRVQDADVLFSSYISDATDGFAENRWLLLKTPGKDVAARDAVLHLDNPEGLYALSGFLNYTSFDPADFPYLSGVL